MNCISVVMWLPFYKLLTCFTNPNRLDCGQKQLIFQGYRLEHFTPVTTSTHNIFSLKTFFLKTM